MRILLYILADISMVYFLLLLLKVGPASLFCYFFLVLSILLFLIGRLLDSQRWRKVPKWCRILIYTCFFLGLSLFFGLEALIISNGLQRTEQEADYVVVLGCRVMGKMPSLSLQYRIDAAVEYLQAHPQSRAVLTGGQGIGEDITEAEAMYAAMLKQGIARERLLLEKASTNTKENLEFAKQYINPENDRIVIVSTNFHMYRAGKIARAAGYKSVEGYSAKSVWYLIPADYIREALAVVKNLILGNMG